uniref:Enoyl reductase (ER) domain-containing protein n=1 Tax=Bionectria ochroleuca TaxID=29856 RepID=A0A8H7KDU0_BIOOC
MALPDRTKQWVVERFDGPSGLEFKEADIPKLGNHDILIKVHAISLNYHDVGTLRGHYQHAFKGVVPVSDGSGIVISIGSDVTSFQPGDKVATVMSPWESGPLKQSNIDSLLGNALHGVLQEYAVVPEQHLISLPQNLSFVEGSTLPVAGLAAWNAINGVQGRPLLPGQWVLTQGTGGVSTFVILALTAGADHVINYKEVPDWGDRAKALTPGGEGVDLVIEIGGGATLKQSLSAVRLDGLISVVGLRGGVNLAEQPVLLDMFFRFCTIRIAVVGPRVQFKEMNRFIESKGIKPVVDDRNFKLEEAKDAFEYLESMGHFGKVCIKVVNSD